MSKLKHILIISVFFILNGCMFFEFMQEPPGKGATANEWYKKSEPIIKALENYKATNKKYPISLQNLIPAYTTSEVKKEINKGGFEYQRENNSYALTFTYYRPGVNICVYHPNSKWKCSGYY